MRGLWVLTLVVGCVGALTAQAVHSAAVPEFPPYKVYPGAIDEDGFPLNGARLCTIQAKPQCFTLSHSGVGSDEDDWSYFGLRATSKRIKINSGGSVVLFNANCGGGSGSSDRYVLLRSEPDRHLKNLLPEIILTNQAEVAMWDLPTISPMPVLLTADYIWGHAEAHYGSHFFVIQMYIYEPASDRYKLRRKYQTLRKYPGIDNWEQAPEVLEKERARIIEQLGRRQ